MSISKDRGRKKPLIAWSRSSTCNRGSVPTTSIIIIALTILLTGGGFVLIISPTLVASALAQEWITAISITDTGATTTDTTTEASPPPGMGFSPQTDLNFSEFPEFDDFSQLEDFASPSTSSFMTEVNGTYTNPNIGFQIDLPTGWKGTEINFLINSVFAVPGETDFELLTTQQGAGGGGDFQEPATFMTTVGIDQQSFNILESVVSQLPALGQGGGGSGGQAGGTSLPQGGSTSDPLGTTTTMTPFRDSTVSCTFSQPSFVTINGINAEERVGECIDEGAGGVGAGELGTNPKTKSYAFATQNNSLIIVGFYANSTSTYDQNLPLFEESVRTISISQPADIATSEIYNRYKEFVEMQQQQQLLSNQTGGAGM
jgi:hypothetical protein